MRGKDQGYQGYLISGWEETRNGFRSTATEVSGPTGELSHTQFGGCLQSVQGPGSRGHSHDCWSRGSYSLFTSSMSMTPFPGTSPVFIPDLTILTSSPCWVCLKISTPKFDGWELRTLFLHIFPLLLHSNCFIPWALARYLQRKILWADAQACCQIGQNPGCQTENGEPPKRLSNGCWSFVHPLILISITRNTIWLFNIAMENHHF